MLNQYTEWNSSSTKSQISFLKDEMEEYESDFWENVAQYLGSNNFKYDTSYV